LEPLKGDMAGRFSLRVNDQYRITFQWEQKGPYADDVTCEDYH
jgi:proteic killer suppression protein